MHACIHVISAGCYVQLIKHPIHSSPFQCRAQQCDLNDICHASIGCVLVLVQCFFQKVPLKFNSQPQNHHIFVKRNFSATMRVTVGLVGDKLSLWHVTCQFEPPWSGLRAIVSIPHLLNYITLILLYAIRVYILFIRYNFPVYTPVHSLAYGSHVEMSLSSAPCLIETRC
jgi:hypothetical protein